MRKINRSIEEKIIDCLDNHVKNLCPNLRKRLLIDLQNIPEANNVVVCKGYVSRMLNLPEMGRHAKQYWVARGWTETEAYLKSKRNSPNKGKISPFSREFWISKINPNTGKNYSIDEADFERNSRRPIRKEYWIKKGYSDEKAVLLALETKNKNNQCGAKKSGLMNSVTKRSVSRRCIEYWLSRGYTEIEAREKVSEQQSTFSLEKCITKYGEKEGRQRWLNRQEKWHNSYKKSNFSKISQTLFWEIVLKLTSLENIYFAQLDENKNKDLSGKNHELRLKLDSVLLPDFIDISSKKIIEFDGTYWHGRVGKGNKNRDLIRDEVFKKYGYKVLRISENEYKTNCRMVVEKCLNFLIM